MNEYLRAEVKEILEEGEQEFGESFQRLKLELNSGENKGEIVEAEHVLDFKFPELQKREVGDNVVLVTSQEEDNLSYTLLDTYRVPALLWIFVLFFVLVILLGKRKGFFSILGLGITVAILLWYVVPSITSGKDPFLTALIGSVMIAVFSLFTAHGFHKRTAIALLSTALTLGIAALLGSIFVDFAHLLGLGSEEVTFLELSEGQVLNLRGLLLAGIVIGTLGVLDDITTSQTAALFELKKVNPTLNFRELYKHGISVGREHIASLVNTLVLAYAGASLPLFLLFTMSNTEPLWVRLNSEFVAEEIVRTLVGSIALVLAVPISTILAAYFLRKEVNMV